MKNEQSVRPTLLALALALALAFLALAPRALAAQGDEQAVRNAASQFYAALNVMFTGDAAPMKAVWSHADDVVYMGPNGGQLVGWPAVAKIWDTQAALELGGKVDATDMQVVVSGDLGVTWNYEKGENVGADGKPQQVSIRATNVFRREGGTWKMIGHHTDLLAFLSQ